MIDLKIKSKTPIYVKIIVILSFLTILTIFNGAMNYLILIGFIISMLLTVQNKYFYLHIPIIMFFGQIVSLPLFFNLDLFDFFIVIFLFRLILMKKTKIRFHLLASLLVIALYGVLVVGIIQPGLTITIILTSIFVIYSGNEIIKDKELMKYFSDLFILSTLLAAFYGLVTSNVLESLYAFNGISTSISRNLGTFDDPNHFGLFINVSIFFTLSKLNKENRYKLMTILLFLYGAMFTTLSITALVCNVISIVIFYLVYTEKPLEKLRFFFFLTLIFTVALFIMFQFNFDIINNISNRISATLNNINNLDAATSNRTIIWNSHISFFINQEIGNVFFGGNFVTDYGRGIQFTSVSHNSFIDMILNFGLIGSAILLNSYIVNTIKILKKYKKTKNKEYLGFFMTKTIWFIYAFGLSMFPGWIFQFFFLI